MEDKMKDLLADLEVKTAKEKVKQEKAVSIQMTVEAELLEEAKRLEGQSETIRNLQIVTNIAESLNENNYGWVDESVKRQIQLLLKDAMKRARHSFK